MVRKKYLTIVERRRKWYRDGDIVKALYLLAGCFVLGIFYVLVLYAGSIY